MSSAFRPPAPWFERICAAAAFFVPFEVALLHVGSSSAWRDDLPLLRGLAWVGNGRSSGLWCVLVQASFFLPLGSLYFRASAAAALALGASGLAIFFLTKDILAANADAPRLTTVLSAIAALTATLSLSGQREGTVAGGACVAVLVALVIVRERPSEALGQPRRALYLGLLFGALLAENWILALAVLIGTAVGLVVSRTKPPPMTWPWAAFGCVATSVWLLLPFQVRPFALRPVLDLGRSVVTLGSESFDAPARSLGGIGALRADVGVVALCLALLGAVVGTVRTRLRQFAVPLVAIVVLDVLASLRENRTFLAEEITPLHVLALSALCIGVAIAIQTIATTLLDLGLPLAKGATIFLAMTDLTLAATSAEEASFAVDRSYSRGAEAFTDEAFERLAPGTVTFLRSPASVFRFWSARVTYGMRPDVLVVPTPWAGDPRLAVGLLRAEPALQQALRDVALEGRAGEEALTIVADARPVLVELEPRWDRRVISHLVADHFWLRFAPEPLGPSDRKAAFADLRSRFDRVFSASVVDERPDPSTAAVLRARLTDAAAEAAMLGDRDEAISLLQQLGRVSSGDRFVAELTERLAATKSGAVDIKGLLR
jgi:hypothetical protein